MNLQVIGTIFGNVGSYGDFNHMIKSNSFSDALFIYNDNEESYYKKSFKKGAGNACIRVFNKYNTNYEFPMSAGIPTGTLEDGGYQSLNTENIIIIDDCINQIIELIKTHKKQRLFYSAENSSGILGSGIFDINENVLKYISCKLHALSKNDIYVIKSVYNTSFENNYEIEPVAKNNIFPKIHDNNDNKK
jgi:hypothetical protein